MKFAARRVEVDGSGLAVFDPGGPGEPLVFLHGNMSRWQHWRPQLESFGSRYRCIAFDQLGYGASDPVAGSTGMVRMASQTVVLARALGVSRAHYVGLSMGGTIGQAVALVHPDAVATLTLAGSYRNDSPHPALAEGMNRLLALAPLSGEEFVNALIPLVTARHFREQHRDELRRMVRELAETDRGTMAAMANQAAALELSRLDPAGIRAPTLVIGGAEDQLIPAPCVRHLAGSIKGAEYVELDCGHLLNLELPAEFDRVLADFLGRHPLR